MNENFIVKVSEEDSLALEKKQYELKYPYETDEYKIYELENGRKYRVYKNGRVL